METLRKQTMFSNVDILEFGNTLFMAGVLYTRADASGFLMVLPGTDELDDQNTSFVMPTVEEWTQIVRQLDIQEIEVVQGDKLKKAILRKSQRQVEARIRWSVFRRDRFMCRYCGADAVKQDHVVLDVDHVILWEHQGPTIPENLFTSCRKCNKKRGNLEYEEWLQTDYYQKVSQRLDPHTREANEQLVEMVKNPPFALRKHGKARK